MIYSNLDNYQDQISNLTVSNKWICVFISLFVFISSEDNFLPRLYAGLEARGVPYIPLYEEFVEAKAQDWIYYGSDTHWTQKGLDIALNKTLRVLDTL